MHFASGKAYNPTALKATGGTAKYTWSKVAGPIPPGLTLNASGIIKGTLLPGSSGVYNFTVRVSDGIAVATRELSITVYNPLVITPLSQGIAGEPYTCVFSATGGSGGYKFSIVGSSPSWLKFNASTATISSTNVREGTYIVKVKVTDNLKCSLTQTLTLTINTQ